MVCIYACIKRCMYECGLWDIPAEKIVTLRHLRCENFGDKEDTHIKESR